MFVGSVPLRNAPFGHGVGPIWLDNLYCLGNESSLINCSHRGLGVISTYCDHHDDVGVQCIGKCENFNLILSTLIFANPCEIIIANDVDDCSHGQLRLVGGSSENEGRVEICYQNRWGTICDNGWSSEDAKVVCRQLGFQATGELYTHS